MIPESRIRAYAEESWRQPPSFELPLPDLRGAVVLDLCGGPGVYTRALTLAGARRVVWFDGSETMRAIAEEKLAALPGIEFGVGDMADLSRFPDACFDGVFFRDALHQALDPTRVIREIARVLEPGGWLYLFFATVRRLTREPKRPSLLLQLPLAASSWAFGRSPRAMLFSSRRMVRRGLAACGLPIAAQCASGSYHVILARRQRA